VPKIYPLASAKEYQVMSYRDGKGRSVLLKDRFQISDCVVTFHSGWHTSYASSGMENLTTQIALLMNIPLYSKVLSVIPPDLARVRTIGQLPDITQNPPGEVQERVQKRRRVGKGWEKVDAATETPVDGEPEFH
jgi:hypothetical protein